MPYIHCNINFVHMYTIQIHSREILFVWPSCLTAVKPHCLGPMFAGHCLMTNKLL